MTLNIAITRRSGLSTSWQIDGTEQDAVRAILDNVDRTWRGGFHDDGDLPQVATVGTSDGQFFRVYRIPTDNTRDLVDLDITS